MLKNLVGLTLNFIYAISMQLNLYFIVYTTFKKINKNCCPTLFLILLIYFPSCTDDIVDHEKEQEHSSVQEKLDRELKELDKELEQKEVKIIEMLVVVAGFS